MRDRSRSADRRHHADPYLTVTEEQNDELPTHVQHVIEEQTALNEKLTKLVQFILVSPEFRELSFQSKDLLRNQRDMMMIYSDILDERIALMCREVDESTT